MLKKHVVNESKNLNGTYLQECLESHKNIFSRYIYEYLECLIGLEIAFLKRGYISNEERASLMQLEFIKDVAKYNIYERSYKVFLDSKAEYPIHISSYDERCEKIKVMGEDHGEYFDVFDYQVLNNLININLYNLVESRVMREKEINAIQGKIDSLYDNQEEYNKTHEKSIQETIREYQTMRHELIDRGELTSKKAETLQYFYGTLTGSLGCDTLTGQRIIGSMSSSLCKKYPGINVTENIKYY